MMRWPGRRRSCRKLGGENCTCRIEKMGNIGGECENFKVLGYTHEQKSIMMLDFGF
jgi:hypothetical protein